MHDLHVHESARQAPALVQAWDAPWRASQSWSKVDVETRSSTTASTLAWARRAARQSHPTSRNSIEVALVLRGAMVARCGGGWRVAPPPALRSAPAAVSASLSGSPLARSPSQLALLAGDGRTLRLLAALTPSQTYSLQTLPRAELPPSPGQRTKGASLGRPFVKARSARLPLAFIRPSCSSDSAQHSLRSTTP